MLRRREVLVSGVLGAVAAGLGVVAVFVTRNELGSATLLLLGAYLVLAAVLRRFPRMRIGGSEIDPYVLEETRRDSGAAKVNADDAKEGLADTRTRVADVEAALARLALGAPGEPPPSAIREAPPPTAAGGPARRGVPGLDDRLVALAAEYDDVRWTMPSGPVRTTRMTGIVARMVDVCGEVPVTGVEALLGSGDPGLRLVGVAALNARPDPGLLAPLAGVALTPDKPFTEYWALLTLRKVLRGNCELLDPALRDAVARRLAELPRRTDRARAAQAILADCP